MDAIITAGSSPAESDPLYALTGGRPKALLPLAGRPMIAYVVAALAGLREPGRILLYGLPDDAEVRFDVDADILRFPSQGGILENIEAGLAKLRELGSRAEHVIVSGGDVPLLRPDIVDAHVARCLETDHDVYYTVIPYEIMQARFPASRRSSLRLQAGRFCGGDLHVARRMDRIPQRDMVLKLLATRKNVFQQAALFGPGPLLKAATGRLTFAEAERVVGRLFGVRARVVVSPDPELGMDVDKPLQLQIVEEALGITAARGAATPRLSP